MNQSDRECLRDNRIFIIDNLRVADVLDRLLEKKILTSNDAELLRFPTWTERDKVIKLLDILPRRGERAFGEFIYACNTGNHEHVARKLGGLTRRRKSTTSLNEAEFDNTALKEAKRLFGDILREVTSCNGSQCDAQNAQLNQLSQLLSKSRIYHDDNVTDTTDGLTKLHPSSSNFRSVINMASGDDTTKDELDIALLVQDVMVHMTAGYQVDKPNNPYASSMTGVVDDCAEQLLPIVFRFFESLDGLEDHWKDDMEAIIDLSLKDFEWTWLHVVMGFTICGLFAKYVIMFRKRVLIVDIGQFLENIIRKEFNAWIHIDNGWMPDRPHGDADEKPRRKTRSKVATVKKSLMRKKRSYQIDGEPSNEFGSYSREPDEKWKPVAQE